jgi:predicted DNA-binding transcriptional regulator AlpA
MIGKAPNELAEDAVTVKTAVVIKPLLVNVAQVGAMLGGISERQIQRWVSSSKFPKPVDLHCRITRWRVVDVKAWIEGLDTQ